MARPIRQGLEREGDGLVGKPAAGRCGWLRAGTLVQTRLLARRVRRRNAVDMEGEPAWSRKAAEHEVGNIINSQHSLHEEPKDVRKPLVTFGGCWIIGTAA